jgi:hypothetical protein
VDKIEISVDFTHNHMVQFVKLWNQIQDFHLSNGTEDDIPWTLSANGLYSTSSAYKAQFSGGISTNMNKMVWKIWVPQKIKSFACLVLLNRLWMVETLEKRGSPNCGICLLRK